MRYSKFYIILILMLGFISFSCSDLRDDITPPAKIGLHGPNVLVKASADFHGKKLVNNTMESCKQCHAFDYSGGTAGVSCSNDKCHPAVIVHTADINNPASANFHGKFIANSNWNLKQCAQCHGNNYSGGIVSPTCNSCHTQTGGPEACNTCHGDFKNGLTTAPPKAINGATATTDPGVGAHTLHLTGIKVAQNLACGECHIVPQNLTSAGHIDGNKRAELNFGAFTNSGLTKASYDFATFKCNNTYCHGNFEFSKANSLYPFVYTDDKITGSNFAPQWNKVDGTQGKCGTCHGLPPAGHMSSELRSCGTCHQGIVNAKGEIIDPVKHMNGKINVFGN